MLEIFLPTLPVFNPYWLEDLFKPKIKTGSNTHGHYAVGRKKFSSLDEALDYASHQDENIIVYHDGPNVA